MLLGRVLRMPLRAAHEDLLCVQVLQGRDGGGIDIGEGELGQRPWLDGGQRVVLRLGGGLTGTVSGSGARKHRIMILQCAHHARVVGPVADGRLEDDALIVALALPLGLDAVGAGRALLSAFDASFPACTTSLRWSTFINHNCTVIPDCDTIVLRRSKEDSKHNETAAKLDTHGLTSKEPVAKMQDSTWFYIPSIIHGKLPSQPYSELYTSKRSDGIERGIGSIHIGSIVPMYLRCPEATDPHLSSLCECCCLVR